MSNETAERKPSLSIQAVWMLSAKLVAFAFSFALPLVVIRRLSQAEFGLYKLVFMVVGTAVGVLPLGFGMSAFYFLPRETTRRSSVVFNILLFYLVVGGLSAIVLILSPELLARALVGAEVAAKTPEMRSQIAALAPLIGIVIVFWLFSSFLDVIALANHETKQATIFIISASLTKSLLLLITAIVFGSVRALLWATLVQAILQTAILLMYVRSRFAAFWSSFDYATLRKQLIYAAPYGLSALLWTVQTDMHNYFVSHHFGQVALAVYAVGVFQLPVIGIVGESVASVMIPRVSHLQSVDDRREIIRLAAAAMRKLAILFFPIYGFLMIMGREFIVALFTLRYVESWPIFQINLTLLPFAIMPLDSIGRAYQELGRFVTKLRSFSLVVLTIGLWLAAHYSTLRGMIAVVTAIFIVENLIVAVKAARILGVRSQDAVLLKDLSTIAVAVMVAAAATIACRSALLHLHLGALRLGPVWLLCLCAAMFGSTYFGAVLLLGIPTFEERAAIRSRLKMLSPLPFLARS
jgi:O-antigen/teichoic acid export membrane protein